MFKRFFCAIVLALVLSLASGAWAANLVGWWRLDEGSGTIAHDSSGNGYDGTLVAGPQWVAGQIGGALKFSGSNSVDCGSAAKAALLQTLSITCWVNPSDLTNAVDHAFVSRSAAGIGYAFKSYGNYLRFTTPTVLDHNGTNSILKLNTWQHVAVTFTASATGGCKFYINGVLTDTINSSAIPAGSANVEIGHNHWDQYCLGMMDDIRIFDTVLTAKEVQDAMKGQGPGAAMNPVPADKATDVPADSVLAWTAGKYADTHDVYLGAAFTDVNNASRATPAGLLASQGQSDAQFDPPGLLTYGQTYYWRIDEVNKAPDNTIYKGTTWSFTVEPYAYPLPGASITATASSSAPGMGPENTINGSGLTGDLHGNDGATMWTSQGTQPNWIQYQFDAVYKLDKMLVWNYNGMIELYVGFGAKDVTVEYSLDGTTWTTLAGVAPFAQGTGSTTYAANTTVNFGGVQAKYVKLTINKTFGGLLTTGLAEVRFLYVPVQARAPQPADAATGVTVSPTLSWRPGREATSHQVYFGTDPNALANAQTVTEHSFTPAVLNLGTKYYWRVDEVGASGTVPGNVWSFTTQDYLVVEDFEAYDDDNNRVYDSWLDGFDNPSANGGVVGNNPTAAQLTAGTGHFAETTIIHGGKQAMPFFYDNTAAPLSEAVRTLDQNWTTSGVKSLSLWFRGAAGNKGNLYVKINKAKITYAGAATDIAQTAWQPWNIDLSGVAGLNKVTSLTIGVEGAGAKGTLYVDDIRLYPKLPQFVTPVAPSQTGLVAQYAFEGNFKDSVGTHHGTAAGDAKITTDAARGQVATFDGNGDFVDIPYSADLNPPAFTLSLWAKPTTGGTSYRSPLSARDDPPQKGYILYLMPNDTWSFWTGDGTTNGWNNTAGPAATLDEWAHVTATFADGKKVLYVNGRQVGQSTTAVTVVPNGQRPVRLGGGATESATGNYFWRGLLDDVRIYNRALSDAEVAGLSGRTEPLAVPF